MIKKYCMPGQILAILMLFFNVSISVAEEANLLPPPQVAVSPSVIETVLGNKPSNEVIHVYNLGDKPLTISTTVAHWDTNKNNQVRVIPPTEQSLDQWIIINPLSFTIPAGKSQVVRLSIRPQAIPAEGEHRGMVFFENKQDNSEIEGVSALFRIGVGIYGLAGNITRQGTLQALTLDKENNLQFTIKSTGNANIRLTGQYSVWRETDFPTNKMPPLFDLTGKDTNLPATLLDVTALPTTPVLANTTRTLVVPVNVPQQAGEYIVFVNGMLGETPIKQAFDINTL
jgi:P pilus assembly chaperone PapD